MPVKISSPLPVVCLLGPTAAGKTAAALAMADRLPISFISVDSAQVYRGMDIGSAKLDRALLQQYPHALINIRDPEQAYSVAEFCQDARAAIQQAHTAGKVPVLVGGTMMYVRALMQGLSALPTANALLRADLEQQAQQLGWPALHQRLAELDPQTAEKLAPNDGQRIQRALEVFYASGERLSEHLLKGSNMVPPWHFLLFSLCPSNRHVLHQRIADRVEQMLSVGFIDEVECLRSRPGLTADSSSMRSVGYRQVSLLEGDLSKKNLSDEIIFSTRQLAKRQLTWLRQMPGVIWVDGALVASGLSTKNKLISDFLINRVDIFASKTGIPAVY